jgi:hypothetical protein
VTAFRLTTLERIALRMARAQRITSRSLASDAFVTRARAGAALRKLERAELIGGGELGYEPTLRAQQQLGRPVPPSRPVAKWCGSDLQSRATRVRVPSGRLLEASLVVDEVAYILFDSQAVNLMFMLVWRRGSTAVGHLQPRRHRRLTTAGA